MLNEVWLLESQQSLGCEWGRFVVQSLTNGAGGFGYRGSCLRCDFETGVEWPRSHCVNAVERHLRQVHHGVFRRFEN
jgi:hypothetical protein